MTNQPKVSIIMPVYNAARFLRECLDSLLNQTFPAVNYEVVTVNDGSTDDSLAILRSYQSKYPNLLVYDRPHGGISAAVEYGVMASRSEWLAFADSDDWLESSFLETMYRHTARPDCDLVVAHMVLHRRRGDVLRPCSSLKPGFYERNRFPEVVYPGLIGLPANQGIYTVGVSRSSKLFKRWLVMKGLPYCAGLHYAEDKVMVISSVLACNGFTVLDDYYPYHYRLNHKPFDPTAMYQKFKAGAEAIERVAADAGVYDFSAQLKLFLLSGLIYDVNNVVMGVTPWNRAIQSKRLKEIYALGCENGILPSDGSQLDLHWWLTKHGLIWTLGGYKLGILLKKRLKHAPLS